MINDPSPETLAKKFWSGTGLQETFPRNIEQAIAMILPLAVVKMPSVTTGAVRRWLKNRHAAPSLPHDRRDLMGCLVAYRGHGVVFVCGADDPEEQRLTVAHEVGHFLVDYRFPRLQAIQALGERIAEVLDGFRQATPAERANAVLSHVRLGAHVHLLPRRGRDEDSDACVGYAEERAHRLGLELVAPRQLIIMLIQQLAAQGITSTEVVSSRLAVYFGLPANSFSNLVKPKSQRLPVSFFEDAMTAIREQR